MAVSNKIAGAAVVVTANADGLVRGLDQSKKRVEKFGKDTSDVWSKIGERFGGGGGGFVAKSLGAGFFGGMAGSIAIRIMDYVANSMSEVLTKQAKWTQELGRSNLAMKLLADETARAAKVRDEWFAAARGSEKAGLIGKEQGETAQLLAAARAEADGIRNRLELLNSFGLTNIGTTLRGTREKDKAFLSADLSRAEETIARLSSRMGELGEAKRRLDPLFDPAVKSSLNSFMADLDTKMKTMGMSAEEAAHRLLKDSVGKRGSFLGIGEATAKLDEFKAKKLAFEKDLELKALGEEADKFATELERAAVALRDGEKSAERMKLADLFGKGLDGPALARLEKLVAVTEKAKKTKDLKDFNADLQKQITMIGMSGAGAKVLEAAMGGMKLDELWNSGAFHRAAKLDLAGRDAGPKFAAALEAGSAEAYSLEMRHKFKDAGGRGASDPVEVQKEAARTLKRIEKILEASKAGVL